MSGSFGLNGWPESVAMTAFSGPTASIASFIWSEVTDWNIGMQLTAQYSIRHPALASSTWASIERSGHCISGWVTIMRPWPRPSA